MNFWYTIVVLIAGALMGQGIRWIFSPDKDELTVCEIKLAEYEAMHMHPRTLHQQRVDELMRRAGQELPLNPTVPSHDVLLLRARLMLEEVFETVDAMGIKIYMSLYEAVLQNGQGKEMVEITFNLVQPQVVKLCDIIEVADGCADISVVTTGTLSAFGMHDKALLEEVDNNNLKKFGPGGYRDAGGKWIKPRDHKPPDIKRILEEQTSASRNKNA